MRNTLIAASALALMAGGAQAATMGTINGAFNYTDSGALTDGDVIGITLSFSAGSDDLAGYMLNAATFDILFSSTAGNANNGITFTASSGADVITFEITSTEGVDAVPDGGQGIEFGLSATGAQTFVSSLLFSFSDLNNGGTFQSLTLTSPPEFNIETEVVPVPAALPLMASAFGIFGALRLRRKAA